MSRCPRESGGAGAVGWLLRCWLLHSHSRRRPLARGAANHLPQPPIPANHAQPPNPPTSLCKLPGRSTPGSCRVCMVDVNGVHKAACCTPAVDGSFISTDTAGVSLFRLHAPRRQWRQAWEAELEEGSDYCMQLGPDLPLHAAALTPTLQTATPTPLPTPPRQVRDYVRSLLGLIRANHPEDCMTCDVNGRCEFQTLITKYEVRGLRPIKGWVRGLGMGWRGVRPYYL